MALLSCDSGSVDDQVSEPLPACVLVVALRLDALDAAAALLDFGLSSLGLLSSASSSLSALHFLHVSSLFWLNGKPHGLHFHTLVRLTTFHPALWKVSATAVLLPAFAPDPAAAVGGGPGGGGGQEPQALPEVPHALAFAGAAPAQPPSTQAQ